MNKDMKEEIIEKLEYLRNYDKAYQVFGAAKHKYILEPVISAQEVSDIEKKWNIELPKEYREFITEVGNGGAGPAYGLLPFGYQESEDSPVCYAKKFIHTRDYNADEWDEKIPCNSYECKKCENKDLCMNNDFIDGEQCNFVRYQQGSMMICFEGCSFNRRMVLNGPFKGEIWAENEGEGLLRAEHSFFEWYRNWLDRSVDTIRPLVEAIKEKQSFQAILDIDRKGYGSFMFDWVKAEFVAAVVGITTDEYGNSGQECEKYVKRVQQLYDEKIKKEG